MTHFTFDLWTKRIDLRTTFRMPIERPFHGITLTLDWYLRLRSFIGDFRNGLFKARSRTSFLCIYCVQQKCITTQIYVLIIFFPSLFNNYLLHFCLHVYMLTVIYFLMNYGNTKHRIWITCAWYLWVWTYRICVWFYGNFFLFIEPVRF